MDTLSAFEKANLSYLIGINLLYHLLVLIILSARGPVLAVNKEDDNEGGVKCSKNMLALEPLAKNELA